MVNVASTPRKRRTRDHVIGDLAVNFVERQFLMCGHAVNRTGSGQDYGVDLTVLTFDGNGQVKNGQIEIQVRATEQIQPLKSGMEFSRRLNMSHVSHWLMQPNPVILAVYDASADRAWWLNIQKAAEHEDLEDRGETIAVRIQLASDLNSTAIDEMRRDRDAFLVQLHTKLGEAAEGEPA